MDQGDANTIYGVISGAIAAVLAGVVGFMKFKKNWTTDGAEIDVIKTLRDQVAIFSVQNSELHKVVNDLRENIMKLREENFELRTQVNQLKQEVVELTTATHKGGGRRLTDKVTGS